MTPILVGALSALAVASIAGALAAVDQGARLARLGVPAPSHARGTLPLGSVVVAATLSAALLGAAVGGIPLALACGGAAAATPAIVRRRRAGRRDRAVQEQLPEGVGVIAAGLRAGRSLPQAVELAGSELPPPLGPTFARAGDRVRLGEPVEGALAAWAHEVGGPDARLAAGVFGLQRRTGGALSAALDDLAVTLRSRRSAARELRSLTAQARLSAAILGLLPIGFFLFLAVVARRDVEAAFGTPVGSAAVVLGFTLQGCAFVWIRRLLRVEP
jgi:tight adherence protein B